MTVLLRSGSVLDSSDVRVSSDNTLPAYASNGITCSARFRRGKRARAGEHGSHARAVTCFRGAWRAGFMHEPGTRFPPPRRSLRAI